MNFCFALVKQKQSDPRCFSCHTCSYPYSKMLLAFTSVLLSSTTLHQMQILAKLLLVVYLDSNTDSVKDLVFNGYNLLRKCQLPMHMVLFLFFDRSQLFSNWSQYTIFAECVSVIGMLKLEETNFIVKQLNNKVQQQQQQKKKLPITMNQESVFMATCFVFFRLVCGN